MNKNINNPENTDAAMFRKYAVRICQDFEVPVLLSGVASVIIGSYELCSHPFLNNIENIPFKSFLENAETISATGKMNVGSMLTVVGGFLGIINKIIK